MSHNPSIVVCTLYIEFVNVSQEGFLLQYGGSNVMSDLLRNLVHSQGHAVKSS